VTTNSGEVSVFVVFASGFNHYFRSFVVFCGKTHWKANKTEKTLFLIAEKAIKTTDYSGIIAILEVFQVL